MGDRFPPEYAAGSIEELERIVGQLRRRWLKTRINIRGDTGFCRESIMRSCEEHDIGYVLGLRPVMPVWCVS